jgi:hypothetical protein
MRTGEHSVAKKRRSFYPGSGRCGVGPRCRWCGDVIRAPLITYSGWVLSLRKRFLMSSRRTLACTSRSMCQSAFLGCLTLDVPSQRIKTQTTNRNGRECCKQVEIPQLIVVYTGPDLDSLSHMHVFRAYSGIPVAEIDTATTLWLPGGPVHNCFVARLDGPYRNIMVFGAEPCATASPFLGRT